MATDKLYDHFSAISKVLRHRSETAKALGSTADIGKVRELFVAEFLEHHLPQQLLWGDGEIFDSEDNTSGQQDLVIYRGHIPKLHLAGTTNLFLAESVVATVEVKSTLTKDELFKTLDSVARVKQLKRIEGARVSVGSEWKHIADTISCYLFAFGGLTVDTVLEHLETYFADVDTEKRELTGPDVICVLDRGSVYKQDGLLSAREPGRFVTRARDDELALLFTHLVMRSQLVLVEHFHILDYLKHKRADAGISARGA